MKLQVPAEFQGAIIDADGISYTQDASGQIDIPEGKIPHNVWGFGFYAVQDEPAKPVKAKAVTE